jgi:gas vesicle structural protein
VPSDRAASGGDGRAPDLCQLDDRERVSLCEVLDRVLNKGAVVMGEVTISVANVDLVYLGLQLVLTSIETARQSLQRGPGGAGLKIEIGEESVHAARGNGSGRV